jgi:uncharacterized NAD-dependent epimerase/dehydratase family protein
MSKLTHYQGIELPELPEPFFYEVYSSTGLRISAKPKGIIVGALTRHDPARYYVQSLPLEINDTSRVQTIYVNTPQEAVPLLVTWVLLGICKEE